MQNGEPIVFEYNTSDGTTVGSLRLRDAGGAARTLKATERVIIQAVSASLAAAVLWAVIYDDVAGDAGAPANDETMVVLSINSSHVNLVGTEGVACGVGRVPKVIAGVAGLIKIAGTGVIVRG